MPINQLSLPAFLELCNTNICYNLIVDIETGPKTPEYIETFFNANDEWTEERTTKEKAKFVEKSPLKAHLSNILAIGYGYYTECALTVAIDTNDGTDTESTDEHEGRMTARFWTLYHRVISARSRLIGFNSDHFDLPYLQRKAWIHAVKTQPLITKYGKTPDFCFDLHKEWKAGVWGYDDSISLNNLCRALGVQGKLPGVSGANFHTLYQTEREKALEYLRSDIAATARAAIRMGYIR